jgi:type III pantothenate kinase
MLALPLIAVDIGNSSTKLALFSRASAVLPQPEWVQQIEPGAGLSHGIANSLPQSARWCIASVQRESQRKLMDWLEQYRPSDARQVLTYHDMSLAIRAEQPERVGIDRLAACVAVNALRESDRPAIVVCAGSAVTINLVAADGGFEGGAILPGFLMGARALAGADQLPEVLLSPNEPPPPLGKNTEAAIRSGLFWGAVGAVREIVERYAEDYRRPQVFVTGGDLQRLAPLVSADARFVPNLVLSGVAVAARGGSKA